MATDIDVLLQAQAWSAEGKSVALATVVSTWGSAPRRPGSFMASTRDGTFVGSVSGGCVENAVIEAAAEVLEGGTPALVEFGVTDELAWEVGLACGGRVVVRIERIEPDTLDTILKSFEAGRAPVWIAPVGEPGEESVLFPLESTASDQIGSEAARRAIREDRSIEFDDNGASFLARPFNPPARLVIVGAVHIAQALVPMAVQAGLSVAVVDPRPAWINDFRFPSVERIRAWPVEAFAQLEPDHRTAVVTLTHDPKVDDPALIAALASRAFYVGALGSRRTHQKRIGRLLEAGLEEDALQRIHSPVGLDIGARGPAEIAVSVLAQVIQTLRNPAP